MHDARGADVKITPDATKMQQELMREFAALPTYDDLHRPPSFDTDHFYATGISGAPIPTFTLAGIHGKLRVVEDARILEAETVVAIPSLANPHSFLVSSAAMRQLEKLRDAGSLPANLLLEPAT